MKGSNEKDRKSFAALFDIIGKFCELPHDTKSPPGRIALRWKGKCRQGDPPQAENPAKQDSYSSCKKSFRIIVLVKQVVILEPLVLLQRFCLLAGKLFRG